MLKTITIGLCLFLFVQVSAQFNDSTHYRFRFLGTGTLNRTDDAHSFTFSNGIQFNINRKKTALDLSAGYVYGLQNKQLVNNDFSTTANLDFGKGKQVMYEWGLLTYQTSYSLKIDYKVQGGGGIGFYILDSPKTRLSISDGFLYEANNQLDADGNKEVYRTVRNSFRLKYRFIINNIIAFNGTNFVQPSILSIHDYILNFNNDVSVKISKWLNVTSAFSYNRINRTNRQNLLFTIGVSVDRYF